MKYKYGVLVLLGLLILFWGPEARAKNTHVPDLSFYTAQGKKLSFKEFKGKVLIVNFFATYCAPCQVELIELEEIYKRFHPQGLEIISFMVDREGALLLPHIISSRGITYYVAVADDSIFAAFGWPDILPTTFLVDHNGNIVRKIVGFAGRKTLESELRPLLNETKS